MALLTARAAAGRLGVGYSTLKYWIRQGVVRTTRTAGGHHRVAEEEVARLLARSSPVPPAPAGAAPVRALAVLSARNRLRGFVEEVRYDGLLGQVRLRIGDQRLTAVITRDAIDDLHLRRGDEALAVIKSTEIMIARELVPAASTKAARRRRSPPAAASRSSRKSARA
jgi:molybdopterin-binding protein